MAPSHSPRNQSPGASNLAGQDPTDPEMAPGGRRRSHTPKREADLSGFLTSDEKPELIALVTRITDKMQDQITQAFDSSGVGDDKQNAPPSFWSNLPAKLKDLSLRHPEKENEDPATSKPGGSVGGEALESSIPEKGKTEAKHDEAAVGLQELKKEILHFFRRWQTSVHKRVSDISTKAPPNAPRRDRVSSTWANGGPNSRVQPTQSSESTPSNFSRNTQKRDPWLTPADIRAGGRTAAVEADAALIQLYPPSSTSLCSLSMDKKVLILHSMLLLLLSLEHYSAYTRVLLLNMASSLHIPLHILADDEVSVAKSLSHATKGISGDEQVQKRGDDSRNSRRWKVALASAAGAAVIGITGGLAAPLVAAGVGTVLGGIGLGTTAAAGLLGSMAESSLVVGTLFGVYGARASAKMVDQYTKDVQDFAFLPLHGKIRDEYKDGKNVAPEDRRLRVILGISGWLVQKEDVVNPWRSLGHRSEVYALRWELEAMMKMGNSLEVVVKSAAWSLAKKEIIARTSEPAPLNTVRVLTPRSYWRANLLCH